MDFCRKDTVSLKVVVHDRIIKQMSSINYLSSRVSYVTDEDVDKMINTFQGICGAIL